MVLRTVVCRSCRGNGYVRGIENAQRAEDEARVKAQAAYAKVLARAEAKLGRDNERKE